jgi:hypothetical protein
LERIERSTAMLRRTQTVVLGAVLLIGLGGQAPASRTIGTPGGAHTALGNGVGVYDAAGTRRVFIGFSTLDLPVVRESDAAGRTRLDFSLGTGGQPLLNEQSAGGTVRSTIMLSASGEGQATISSEAGTHRASLFESSEHRPNLMMYDAAGNQSGYLAADDTGGYVVLRDLSGTHRVTFGAYTDGTFGISVRSAASAVLWKAP